MPEHTLRFKSAVLSRIQFQLAIVLICFSIVPYAFPQDGEGTPIITNFSPDDYGLSMQNWSLTQDSRGILYVANTNGVLEYDGRIWKKVEGLKDMLVRSLAVDKNDRIYVGAIGEFGFLASDESGKSTYVSLISRLSEKDSDFSDVWKILINSNSVYFVTVNRIYHFQDEKLTAIPVDLAARYGFVINDHIFLLQNGKGICWLNGTELIPLPYTSPISSGRGFTNLAPQGKDRMLIVTPDGSISSYHLGRYYDSALQTFDFKRAFAEEEVIAPFPTGISPYLSRDHNVVYNCKLISGNRYVFTTIKGGMLITDSRGNLLKVINKSRGLRDNAVTDVFCDREENLWLTMTNGIAHVLLNSPISVFNEYNGLESYLTGITRYRGRIIAGTFNGPQLLEEYSLALQRDNHLFHPMISGGLECWQFLPLDGNLLAACSPNILLIDPAMNVRKFESGYPYCIGTSRKIPDTVFVGTMEGLEILKVSQTQSGIMEMKYLDKVFPEITGNIRTIAEGTAGDLWITITNQGLANIRFPSADPRDRKVAFFGTGDGLPDPVRNTVYVINDRILVGTSKGIFEAKHFKGENGYRFFPETSFGRFFVDPPASIQSLSHDPSGRFWISCDRGQFIVRPKPGGGWILDGDSLRPIPEASEAPVLDEKGIYWIPTAKGFYLFNSEYKKEYGIDYPALIRSVSTGSGNELFNGNFIDPDSRQDSLYSRRTTVQSASRIPVIPFTDNTLQFSFSASFFEFSSMTQFAYLLEGFDRKWTEWKDQTSKEYTNLPEGEYTFRVKAQNAYCVESREARFRFRITPPWQRTPIAYFLFFILGAGILFAIIRLYTRRLQKEKARLEKIVAQRTQELKEMSLSDPLTKLRNRRFLTEVVFSEMEAFIQQLKYIQHHPHRRRGLLENSVYGILLLDIDFFKSVNDIYGHQAGDRFLMEMATELRRSVRQEDAVIRWGGDEFLIILKNTDPKSFPALAENLRKKINDIRIPPPGGGTPMKSSSCSIGMVQYPFSLQNPELLSMDQVIHLADLALYRAKENGRNRAVHFDFGGKEPESSLMAGKLIHDIEASIREEFIRISIYVEGRRQSSE